MIIRNYSWKRPTTDNDKSKNTTDVKDGDSFTILSCNIRSGNKMRDAIFQRARDRNADLTLLQETHLQDDDISAWEKQWGSDGHLFANNGPRSKAGQMILCKDHVIIDGGHEICDQGRIHSVSFHRDDMKFLIVNVYGPHIKQHRVRFLDKLYETLEENSECDVVILGGDFNIVPHHIWDKQGGSLKVHASQPLLRLLMQQQGLVDIAREQQPLAKMFTWSQATPPVACRLDYFLVSESCRQLVKEVSILPMPGTDHKCIELVLTLKSEDVTS